MAFALVPAGHGSAGRATLLAGLLCTAAAALAAPPPCEAELDVLAPLPAETAPGSCEAKVEAVRLRFEAYREEGNEGWADLLPLLEDARRCLGGAPSPLSAALADYETSLLLRTRRYDEADAAFERFFEAEAATADAGFVARMRQRRGLLYTRMGRHAASLQEYVRAGGLVDRLPPLKGAELLVRVGNRFRHLNELARAARYYASADSLLRAHYPADPALAAPLGRVRTYQGALLIAEAEQGARPVADAAREALPLIEEAIRLIPDEPGTLYERVQARIWLGIARRRGGDPEAALAPLAEARRLSAPVLGRYPHWTSWAMSEEGRALIALGRFEEARDVLEAALAIDRDSGRRDNEAYALQDLGALEEALAAAAPARSAAHLGAAERHYREAAALAELARQAYGTLEWGAAAFEELQTPYRRLVRVLLRQGRPEEAFLALDATRARYLRDLRASNRLRATLDTPRLIRLDSLSEALQDARYGRRRPGLPLPEQAALDARIIRLQREVEALVGFTPEPPAALDLAALQGALRERGQILLTYFFDEEVAYAFVLAPDAFAAVRLSATAEALQADLSAIGPMWGGPHAEADPAFALAPLKRLYDALFAPVHAFIPEGAPLLVVPEGPITALPFGMLVEDAGARSGYGRVPFLIRRHAVSTELAAGLLLEPPALRPEAPALDVVAFGRSRFAGLGTGERGLPTGDLPNVPGELRRIGRRVARAAIALDEDATEAALLAQMGEARVVHVASHAVVNAAFPLYSFIALWGDAEAGDDGLLHLYELAGQRLPAELVVLSGCSTARGGSRLGEGMMGLQHAVRAAGAASSLATLWQVDDRAMAEVMDRFYAHLRGGLRKDEALRRAQLDYLGGRDGLAASPFFWAAPVLYGDPRPVALSAPLLARWPLWLALAVGLTGLFALRRHAAGQPPQRRG